MYSKGSRAVPSRAVVHLEGRHAGVRHADENKLFVSCEKYSHLWISVLITPKVLWSSRGGIRKLSRECTEGVDWSSSLSSRSAQALEGTYQRRQPLLHRLHRTYYYY